MALATATAASATSSVVISQFRTQGTGGDFVELANVSGAGVTLSSGSWSLHNLRADGNLQCTVAPNVTFTLAPGQHYLLTQAGWSGSGDTASDATFGGCSTLFDSAGVLNLSANGQSDSVAYGTLNGATANEGTPISGVPSNGDALRRKSSGTQDTDDNSTDFEVVTAIPRGFVATAPAPSGTTDAATNVTETGATLHGTVNPHGGVVSDCHFDFGPTTGYGQTIACSTTPAGSSASAVSADLPGLAAATTYHYRLIVTSNAGTLTAGDAMFTTTTANPPPTGTTDVATNVGSRSATLNATVNPHNVSVSDCHFDYGTTMLYG